VIHARLHIGAGVIMISDAMPNMHVPKDSNVHICLDFDDPADQKKKFDALSVDGKVTMPLQDTFWGATFGMLVDAHDISWMFNCTK
jgi:PhnB protein